MIVPSLDVAQWDADVSKAVSTHKAATIVTGDWISQSAHAKRLLDAAPFSIAD